MQINITLDANSVNQAQMIRKAWYPYTTGRQTRDAFIFNECIDRFDGYPEDLLKIVEREEGGVTVQRMLTINVDSNNRLRTLASSIDQSLDATYRALIAYTIEKIGDQNNESNEKKDLDAYMDDNRGFELLSDKERNDIFESMLPNMSLLERAEFFEDYNDEK